MTDLEKVAAAVRLLLANIPRGADDDWEAGYYDGKESTLREVLDLIEEMKK